MLHLPWFERSVRVDSVLSMLSRIYRYLQKITSVPLLDMSLCVGGHGAEKSFVSCLLPHKTKVKHCDGNIFLLSQSNIQDL